MFLAGVLLRMKIFEEKLNLVLYLFDMLVIKLIQIGLNFQDLLLDIYHLPFID